jgi:2,3-bisphosphoglycerate-independent phosphoglycerate mutase
MRTCPPHDLTGKPVAGSLPDGPGSEVLRDLMARSRAVLAAHPLCQARLARGERAPNAVWLWGQGTKPRLPRLTERFGLTGAVVAGVPLAAAFGMLAGFRRVHVPGATGQLDTDLRAKAEYGLRALEEVDLLFLHVEAPAEGGCLGDPQRKIDAIERFDGEVVAPVLEGLGRLGTEWRMMVMPDHPTPCALRTHTAEPVPFLVAASQDQAKAQGLARGFNERDAREQGIFIAEAHSLLERLLRR